MDDAEQWVEVWTLEGRLQHTIYSPRGSIEGLLLDVEGVTVQVGLGPHDSLLQSEVAALEPDQALVLEASVAAEDDGHEARHEVYELHRLVSIDGTLLGPGHSPATFTGRVIRLNYARHGEPNGVVLDSGHFIHTRPGGMAQLNLAVGDDVVAEGDAERLPRGEGWVVEASRVNGQMLRPRR